MFRFQDLLLLKKVAPPWQNDWFVLFQNICMNTLHEAGMIPKEVLDKELYYDVNILDSTYLDFVTVETQDQYQILENFNKISEYNNFLISQNRDYQKKVLKGSKLLREPKYLYPIQYDMSDYFEAMDLDNTPHASLVKHENKFYDDIIAFVKDNQTHSKDVLQGDISEKFLDRTQSEFAEFLAENKLFFARPPYDNVWCYMGKVDIGKPTQLEQAVHIQVFNDEQFNDTSKVGFLRPHTSRIQKEWCLDEGEFVIQMTTYSITPKGSDQCGYRESDAYIRMDKNHCPVDYHQPLTDTDVLVDMLDETLKNYLFATDGEHYSEEQDNHFGVLTENIFHEQMLGMNRTYLLFELFSLMNMKSKDIPTDDTVIRSVKKDNTFNKKTQKRLKSKGYENKPNEDFWITKVLKVNPLLATSSDTANVPNLLESISKLREHSRAGHTKTYTAEKPRFGRAHKNNIGTFWFPPTTVAKGSRKGKVTKDYEVGI